MSNFSLVPYDFYVRKIDSNERIKLAGESNLLGIDFLDFFDQYLTDFMVAYQSIFTDDSQNNEFIDTEDPVNDSSNKKIILIEKKYRTTRIHKDIEEPDRIISGLFRSGEGGYAYPIVDAENGKKVYSVNRSNVGLHPYYFLTKIPVNSKNGILILQTFKTLGIKGVFLESFNEFFKTRFGDQYVFEMIPIVPKDLVKYYLSNRLVEINLLQHIYPSCSIDRKLNNYPNEDPYSGTFKRTFKPERNGNFSLPFVKNLKSELSRFLDTDDLSITNFVEIHSLKQHLPLGSDLLFDGMTLKVRTKSGYRTIDVSDTQKLNYSDDLDGRVSINEDTGYPDFNSIDELAKGFLRDCATAWGHDRNE